MHFHKPKKLVENLATKFNSNCNTHKTMNTQNISVILFVGSPLYWRSGLTRIPQKHYLPVIKFSRVWLTYFLPHNHNQKYFPCSPSSEYQRSFVCNLHSLQKSSGLWNFLLFKAYPELLPISVLFLCGKLFTYGIFLPPWSTFINITLHKVFMDRKTFCKSLMTNNSQCCTRCPALKSVIPHNYYYFK